MIGSKHTFEIKSHTYYHFGEYESYNCAKIIHDDDAQKTVQESQPDGVVVGKTGASSSSGVSKSENGIPTPLKKSERKLRKRLVDQCMV